MISREFVNSYNKELRSLLAFSKKLYFYRRFYCAKKNIRKTWNIINESQGKHKRKKIEKIVTNNTTLKDPTLINAAFNNHFVNAASELHQNVPNFDNGF